MRCLLHLMLDVLFGKREQHTMRTGPRPNPLPTEPPEGFAIYERKGRRR